jgi:cation transport ATPase
MKKIIIASGHIHALEDKIQKRHAELMEMTRRNAKHFAKRNLPAPKGDSLNHYVGENKSVCEKLAAELFQHLQPTAHFPEAKIDHDVFREKDSQLEAEINTLENENHAAEYELGNFDPSSLRSRIRWAVGASFVILFGEILFNTKAFQIIGESLLFALFISISVSFAIALFSHWVSFLYKGAKTAIKGRVIVFTSLLIVTVVFAAIAQLRTNYLAHHDIVVSPFYFVIINLFFFIVASLLSFFVLPAWVEIKEHQLHLKIYEAILKRKEKITELKRQREFLKEEFSESTKERVRLIQYANHSADTIRKMYDESVAGFKMHNIAVRTDGKVPDCFLEAVTEPNIENVTFYLPPRLSNK